MKILDLQQVLPTHLALPIRMAVEAADPREAAASYIYAGHRLLRMMLGGSLGWLDPGLRRAVFPDLLRQVLQIRLSENDDDPRSRFASALADAEARTALQDLGALAELFFSLDLPSADSLPEATRMIEELASTLSRCLDAFAVLRLHTTAAVNAERPDLLFVWTGTGPAAVPWEDRNGDAATLWLDRATDTGNPVGPSSTDVPACPLLPFPGPEGTTWFETPDGRLHDPSGALAAPFAEGNAGRFLGRLLYWHRAAGSSPAELADRLATGGLKDAGAEVLLAGIVEESRNLTQARIEEALDFLSAHRVADQEAALKAFLFRTWDAEEARLREADDIGGVTNVLLLRQQLQSGPDKALTLSRLVNLFRDRLEDHQGAYYCLLSAVEETPDDEALLRDLEEEATLAGQEAEAAARLVKLARTRSGACRAELASAAMRLYRAKGNLKGAREAVALALDARPDDLELLEEASNLATEASDFEELVRLLEHRREWVVTNAARLEITLTLALVLQRLGRIPDAVAAYRSALVIDPNHREAFDTLLDLLLRSNRKDEARSECAAVAARTFEPTVRVAVLRRYADLLLDVFHDPEAAIGPLTEIAALEPADTEILTKLADLLRNLGRHRHLLGVYRRLAELRPDLRKDYLVRMAVVASENLSDPLASLGFLCEASQADPADMEVAERMQGLYEGLGLWAEVARTLETRLKHLDGPARLPVLTRLVDLYLTRLGQRERAKTTLWEAFDVASGPEALALGRRIAALHREDGQRNEELKALQKVTALLGEDESAADEFVAMARRCKEPPADPDAVRKCLETAVHLNPVHPEAVEMLSAHLLEIGDTAAVVPLVEPLARKAAADGDIVTERRLRLMGAGAAARIGDTESAISLYERAVALEPADFRTAMILGRLYVQAGKDPLALSLLSKVLETCGEELTPIERIEILLTAARSASRIGHNKQALAMFDEAYTLRGARDVASLRELMSAAEAASDPEMLARYLEDLVAVETDSQARFASLLRLGDLYRDTLKKPAEALRWYEAAIAENPTSKAALHRGLDAAVAAGAHSQTKGILIRILEVEQDGLKRAQYHFACAILARDSLSDEELAREHLWKAIEQNPDMEEAVKALEELLAAADDRDGLAHLAEMQARHFRLTGQEQKLLDAQKRLATLYEEKMHNPVLAAKTLREIQQARPDDPEVAARLADLLLKAPGHEQEALEEHRKVVTLDPTRVESYRAIRQLLKVQGDEDGAWCATGALVVLGKATPEEIAFYESLRQPALRLKRESLPTDAMKKLILCETADPLTARVLELLYNPLRSLLPWKKPKDLGLGDADLVDMNARGLLQNMARAASKVLGIDLPRIYHAAGRSGLAKVAFDPPALVVGDDVLNNWRGKEYRFALARALVSFAPGFLLAGISDVVSLRLFFLAGLRIAFPDVPVPPDAEGVEDLAHALAPKLSAEARAELIGITTVFRREKRGIDLSAFLAGIDRSACRAGLFLANDLVVAAEMLHQDSLFLSDLEFGDRLTDLCAYSVSTRFRDLRRTMLQTGPIPAAKGGGSGGK